MRRLLIVTAHFPPTNAVDMHRVRLSLPYYRQYGFEPTVLCFEHESTQHPADQRLLESVPTDIRIERVRSRPNLLTRAARVNAVGIRGLPALRAAGMRLLKESPFDLVYFSTTAFPLMTLGPVFERAFGIPFVLDFQDPWYSSERSYLPGTVKNRAARLMHRFLEPRVVPHAAGLTAVSPGYLNVLAQRYERVRGMPQAAIPFPSADVDLAIASRMPLDALFADPPLSRHPELQDDLQQRCVGLFTGRAGGESGDCLAHFFAALRMVLVDTPGLEHQLRLWFIGSNYSPLDSTSRCQLLADRMGVGSVVRECPTRAPYYSALALQSRASFGLLFGSASKDYNPSKTFTMLATGRPLLAVVPSQTHICKVLHDTGGCAVLPLEEGVPVDTAANDLRRFLDDVQSGRSSVPPANRALLQQFAPDRLTAQQCAVFEQALEYHRPARSRSSSARQTAHREETSQVLGQGT